MNIWIDADSCPQKVRNHTTIRAEKLNIPVTFVANKAIFGPKYAPFEMQIVETQKDSADNYIIEHAQKGDLVITKDIIFADRLLKEQIAVINDRGKEFTSSNIKDALSDRDFDFQLAQIGLVKHYHEGYDQKKFTAFANCLEKVITRLLTLHQGMPS